MPPGAGRAEHAYRPRVRRDCWRRRRRPRIVRASRSDEAGNTRPFRGSPFVPGPVLPGPARWRSRTRAGGPVRPPRNHDLATEAIHERTAFSGQLAGDSVRGEPDFPRQEFRPLSRQTPDAERAPVFQRQREARPYARPGTNVLDLGNVQSHVGFATCAIEDDDAALERDTLVALGEPSKTTPARRDGDHAGDRLRVPIRTATNR